MYSKYAEARDRLGLTDYKVSQMTGIRQSTISDWKLGKSTPKTDKLLKIAKVVGETVESLIEEV